VAALRDKLAANESGIVWIDDLDEVEPLEQLLRQTTSFGSVSKKGEDRTTTVSVKLRAPVVLSGEHLAVTKQKALADRTLLLEVTSPTERTSLHDPSKLQWEDITETKRRYPDLTEASGTLMQMALANLDVVDQFDELRTTSGRFGDKMAIVRVGARLLARLTGDEGWVAIVDAWVGEQRDLGDENALTLDLLPWALRAHSWPSRVDPPNGRWPATPTFVKDGQVRFNAENLSEWVGEMKHGRISLRLETADALRQQAGALGITGTEQVRVGHGRTAPRVRYFVVGEGLSELIVARSRSEVVGGVIEAEERAREAAVQLSIEAGEL
jgi:hypothetical protein